MPEKTVYLGPDEPTQAELDQADPIGGTAVLPGGVDTQGNPAVVADDQEPVSRYEEEDDQGPTPEQVAYHLGQGEVMW